MSAPGDVDKDEQSIGERIPLSSIKAVAAHLPFVDAAHIRITTDMEAMVYTGLGTFVSPHPERFVLYTVREDPRADFRMFVSL